MTDREKKIIMVSTPPKKDNYFLALFDSEQKARNFSNTFIIPRTRLTMPEIMNRRKPCATCFKTDQECPDRKDAIVMCIGDKDPIRPWEYITKITASAVQAGKAMRSVGIKAAEAGKALKKAMENIELKSFTNTHLGEPYQGKKTVDLAGKIPTKWDNGSADIISDLEKAKETLRNDQGRHKADPITPIDILWKKLDDNYTNELYVHLCCEFHDLNSAKEFMWRFVNEMDEEITGFSGISSRALSAHVSTILEGKTGHGKNSGCTNYLNTKYGSDLYFAAWGSKPENLKENTNVKKQ